MAGFFDKCLASAVEQGAISQADADTIKAIHDDQYAAAGKAGEADPAASAREAAARIFDEEASQKRRVAKLATENRDALMAYGESYRTPVRKKADIVGAWWNKMENFGFGAGTSSFAGAAKAKYTMATARLADLMDQFAKSKLTGIRQNKVGAEDMVRAVWKKPAAPESQVMADAVNIVNREVREDFNAKGGNIPELEGPWLPQIHNPAAVASKTFEEWRDYMFRNGLDLNRMRDPLSGTPLKEATSERIDELFNHARNDIVTGGWASQKPSTRPIGAGPLYRQRLDHRFFHWETPEGWINYNRDFGTGDPITAIFQHLRSITKDTAAMETFGPNPNATVEWMKQVISSEAAKSTVGEPSLFRKPLFRDVRDQITYAPKKLQALYDTVKGSQIGSANIAAFYGDVRNILGAAQLGSSAVLAATQDPVIDMSARRLSGLPMTRALGGILKTFSSSTRQEAARAGLGIDEFIHILGNEARYAGVLGGHDKTRWLVERTLNWSGLEAITQARKHLFGLDFMAAVADRRDKSFEELGNEMPAFRRTFEDYGLGEKDWDKIRATEPHIPDAASAGLLRPVDVADTDRRLGERYLEMMLQQTERAVPSGTARSKVQIAMGSQAGTHIGEIVRSTLQYKAFSLSLISLQLQGIMMEGMGGHAVRGAAYGGSVLLGMTIAGAAAMQLKNLANGKDVQDMSPSNVNFWIQALAYGGGLGVMGDFVLSENSRFGHTPLETFTGPTYGLAKDVAADMMIGNFAAWRRGDKTHLMRDVINKGIGRYTPAVSSLWYTRLAYRRMLLDQLQYAADPDAHQHFRRTEQNLHRESGQGYFWRPGETLPERSPVFAEKPERHSEIETPPQNMAVASNEAPGLDHMAHAEWRNAIG